MLALASLAFVSVPIGSGKLYVLGIGLTIDPEKQTVPISMDTAVNANFFVPTDK